MMTSENYTTPRRYKVETTTGRLYDKETNVKDTATYIEDNSVNPREGTDFCSTENGEESLSNSKRRSRTRSKDHISEDSTRNSAEIEVEGATAQGAEKPKSLKKEKASGKKRKERKNLREKRRSTGVVIMPGMVNDEQADDAKQTLENTKMNESIGFDDYSPSPSEVSTSSTPDRSSRLAHGDVDLSRQDKQDLIDRIKQLETALEQKTKEVETLKSENQALLRVVNQVSSLKMK